MITRVGVDLLRILIIDDDETDRRAVQRCLLRSGLPSTSDDAATAAEALSLVSNSTYDCVLLDYYLPDMPGLSLFQSLRAVAPDMPVVIFTGRGDEDVAVELMKAGAADYLPKASITPERLAAGLRHALGLARATVARRQAEDELRSQESRFRTLANAIPQLAWMADAQGARHWFNQRWFDYTGTALEEMRDWGWRSVHHPDNIEHVTELVHKSCETGEPWEFTCPLRGKDGNYRWFLSRSVPIRATNEEILGWLGTNTDVTDQKNAEVERERLLMLERAARSKAESAIRDRDALLALVVHDLRNPLNAILLAANAIPISAQEDKRGRMLEHIQRAVAQMDRLVSDLFDVSNLESGQFAITRTRIDLRALLEEAAERFALFARKQNISFVWEIDAALQSVNADRNRLLQVIDNLLGNSLKFTFEGGHVSLIAYKRGDYAEVAVRDSGIGIAPENLPHIFDRFWRADHARTAGAGLGLAICKGIVEGHGGQIWAEGTVGVGTSVYVRIPCR